MKVVHRASTCNMKVVQRVSDCKPTISTRRNPSIKPRHLGFETHNAGFPLVPQTFLSEPEAPMRLHAKHDSKQQVDDLKVGGAGAHLRILVYLLIYDSG